MGKLSLIAKQCFLAYKVIYFDLDDTLLDHKAAERAGLTEIYACFPVLREVAIDRLADTYYQINRTQWERYSRKEITREQLQQNRFKLTLLRLGLDARQHQAMGRYYMRCYRNHWQWISGAKEAYDNIRRRYPVGILTNGFTETQQKKFKYFNFYTTADYRVISEEVGALKPDPNVFEHATKLAGVAPDQVLYIGDSFTSDIEGGANYGWNTAWFTRNGKPGKHRKADYVFNNFNYLSDYLKV